jgi:hypothetical protein
LPATAKACWGVIVLYSGNQSRNDIITLRGIVRGPGHYATPSADRVDRLMQKGLIKKKRGNLRATLKGRLVALLSPN